MSGRGVWLNPNFKFEVMRGNIPGWSWGQYFSVKQPIAKLTAQAIWETDLDEYSFLTSATVLQVSSSNAADIGTVLQIVGLNSNLESISELVVLNGQSGVATLNSFYRINDFLAVDGQALAGTVYLSKSGDTLTAGVPAVANQLSTIFQRSQFSALSTGLRSDNWAHTPAFTVPAGHTAFLIDIACTSGQGEELTFYGRARRQGTVHFTNQYPLQVNGNVQAVDFWGAVQLSEGTDFVYYANKVGQNANASVKTSYLLRKNSINTL